jgi:large subunit ribosomal protein L13
MSSRRQTFLAKPGQVAKGWHIVDAEGVPLGRLAAEVAQVLMGKHRPEYTPHVDTGEFVVVTNAQKVGLTGRKAEHRLKMRYTKYPGGLKTETYGQVRDRKPELLIEDAIRRMMPKNRLSRVMLKNLKVVPGAEHEFAGQKPQPMTIPVPSSK